MDSVLLCCNYLLNSINPIASESLSSPELCCFYTFLAISGGEGNSEAPVRADCLPAGTFQYRSPAGSHHFHLCNYRDDYLRSCEAPGNTGLWLVNTCHVTWILSSYWLTGSRGRFGQLWNLRSINAAFVQVCTKKVLSKFYTCRDSSNRITRLLIWAKEISSALLINILSDSNNFTPSNYRED